MGAAEERAHQRVAEKAALLDETSEFKRALIWKVLYDGAEDKRGTVLAMSREEIHSTIVR